MLLYVYYCERIIARDTPEDATNLAYTQRISTRG